MTKLDVFDAGASVGETDVVEQLDNRVDEAAAEFYASHIWRRIADPTSTSETIAAIIREIYWEVWCYQPLTTAAGFLMIGRIDSSDRKQMKTLLLHKWEEVEHRDWALDGYLALGGDATRVQGTRLSPGAFAMAAVWERLATQVRPLAYVGAEYLFEALTAQLTQRAVEALRGRSFPRSGLRFIVDHATEDEKHKNLLRHLIAEIVEREAGLRDEILYSFDCFRHVYPLPLWIPAVARAGVLPD